MNIYLNEVEMLRDQLRELEEENRILKERNLTLNIEVQLVTNALREISGRVVKLEVRNE